MNTQFILRIPVGLVFVFGKHFAFNHEMLAGKNDWPICSNNCDNITRAANGAPSGPPARPPAILPARPGSKLTLQ